jgi:hypothetical protein
MRCRISGQSSTVKRDARPSDALHVGHVGIVIQIRVVLGFLFDNAENPGGGFTSLLTTRYRRSQDPTICVINGNTLVLKRYDCHDWLAGDTRLDRAFAPTAPGVRLISSPDQRGQTGDGKMHGPEPSLFALRFHKTRHHARPIRGTSVHSETHSAIPSDMPARNLSRRARAAEQSAEPVPPSQAPRRIPAVSLILQWQRTVHANRSRSPSDRMSGSGRKPTIARWLFYHLVSAGKQRRRHGNPEPFSRS